METPKRKYLKVSDFGDHFNLSKFAVYRMIREGEVPSVRVGKSWRIPADAIEKIESEAAVMSA